MKCSVRTAGWNSKPTSRNRRGILRVGEGFFLLFFFFFLLNNVRTRNKDNDKSNKEREQMDRASRNVSVSSYCILLPGWISRPGMWIPRGGSRVEFDAETTFLICT